MKSIGQMSVHYRTHIMLLDGFAPSLHALKGSYLLLPANPVFTNGPCLVKAGLCQG